MLTPEQWAALLGAIGTIFVAWVRGQSDRKNVSTTPTPAQPSGPNFAADWADSLRRIFNLEKQLEQSLSREAAMAERIEVLESQLSKQPELERQIRELTAAGERESMEKAAMVAANARLAADLEKIAAERDYWKAQTAILKAIIVESIDPNHTMVRGVS